MSALAAATGSINLGQGFPDTDGPEELIEAASPPSARAATSTRRATASPSCARPSPTTSARFYGLDVRPRHRGPGHRRAPPRRSPPRCWRCASRATRSSSSSRTTTRTPPRARWPAPSPGRAPAPARLARSTRTSCAAAVTPRTKLVLLNSPHNPTGKVFSPRGAGSRSPPCASSTTPGVTDEVYEHLVFDGDARPARHAARHGGAHADHLVGGKTFSVTGWKVGWVSGPAPLVGRGARGQAVPHLHQRRAVPARHRARPAVPARRHGPRSPPTLAGEAGPALRRARGARVRRCFRPAATYFATTDIAPVAPGRAPTSSAWRCPSGAVSWPSRARSSTTRPIPRPAGRWCAGPSASGRTSWTDALARLASWGV